MDQLNESINDPKPITQDYSLIINKKIKVKDKTYSYNGPSHPQIITLLEAIDEENNQDLSSMDKKIQNLEESLQCTTCDGLLKFNFYDFILYCIFFLLWVAFFVQSLIWQAQKQPTYEWQSIARDNIYWLGSLFVFQGLIFLKLHQFVTARIVFFFLMVIIPGLWILNDVNYLRGVDASSVDWLSVAYKVISIIFYLHWTFVCVVKESLDKLVSKMKSTGVVILWCILIPYVGGFYGLQIIVEQQDMTDYKSYTSTLLNLAYAPVILALIIFWVIVQNRMFYVPLTNLQQAILEIKSEVMYGYLRPEVVILDQQKSWWSITKNQIKIFSILIGFLFIGCQVYCLVALSIETVSSSPDGSKIIIIIVLLAQTALFLVFGTTLAFWNGSNVQAFFSGPLFFGITIELCYSVLSYYMESINQDLAEYKIYIFIMPLMINLIWFLMVVYGIQNRLNLTKFLCISFYFCYWPIAWLIPISIIYDFYDKALYFILCFVGLGILIAIIQGLKKLRIVIQERLENKHKMGKYIDFGEMAYINLKDCGFFINTMGLLVGILTLLYVSYYAPNTATDDQIATIKSLYICLIILFVLINLVLRPVTIIDPEHDVYTDSEQEKEELIKKIQEKNRSVVVVTRTSYGLLAVLCLLVFLPVSFATSNAQLSQFFFVLAFGIPTIIALYLCLHGLKMETLKFQNFFIPFLSSLSWCCCLLPFCVLVPSAVVMIGSSSDYYYTFIKIVIIVGAFLAVLAVTGFSILLQIILNKAEFEKRKKQVAQAMVQQLQVNAVKSDENTVALIYERYIKNVNELTQLKKLILDGHIINKIPIPNDPDMTVEYKLVNEKWYSQYQKKIIKNKLSPDSPDEKVQNVEKQQNKCFQYITFCLYCKYGENYKEEEDKSQIELEDLIVPQEEQMFSGFVNDLANIINKQIKSIQTDLFDQQINLTLNQKEMVNDKSIMGAWKNQAPMHFTDVKSSKTDDFVRLEDRVVSNQMKKRFKNSDFGRTLEHNADYMDTFMQEVFRFFANTDDNLPPTIIFMDFLQFLRLSNLINRSEIPGFESTLDDQEESYLTYQEAEDLYRRYSTQPWKHHIFGLNLYDFSKMFVQLVINEYENLHKETSKLVLQFVYDVIFPTLMFNLPGISKQFIRIDIVQQIDENDQKPFVSALHGDFKHENEDLFIKLIERSKACKIETEPLAIQIQEQSMEKEQLQRNQISAQVQAGSKDTVKKDQRNCFQRCCMSCCRYLREKLITPFTTPTPQQKQLQVRNMKTRSKMPPWPEVVSDTLSVMVQTHEELIHAKTATNFIFKIQLSNMIALFGRLSDTYTLLSISFYTVDWSLYGDGAAKEYSKDNYTFLNGYNPFSSVYQLLFIIASSITLLYSLLAYFAAKYMWKGTLGLDNEGIRANFPHPQYLLTVSVNILGSSAFMFVMKTFLDGFVCGSQQSYMIRDETIECYSDPQLYYMGIAMVGLLLYYPTSTFLFPNFQFADCSLDLKYSPEYLVIYIQIKLLILTVSSFFQQFEGNTQRLALLYNGFCSAMMVLMIFIYIRVWPCFIQWFNYVELVAFLIILLSGICAIIINIFSSPILGLIIFLGGSFFFLVVAFILFRIYNVSSLKKTQKQMVQIQIENNLQDIVVRQADSQMVSMFIDHFKSKNQDDIENQINLEQVHGQVLKNQRF